MPQKVTLLAVERYRGDVPGTTVLGEPDCPVREHDLPDYAVGWVGSVRANGNMVDPHAPDHVLDWADLVVRVLDPGAELPGGFERYEVFVDADIDWEGPK